MRPHYWDTCIFLSSLHVIYCYDDIHVDMKAMKDWCNAFRGRSYKDLCYKIMYEERTWSNADRDCRERDGQLIKADTEALAYHVLDIPRVTVGWLETNSRAAQVLLEGVETFWAGARVLDGKYQWTDGTPVATWGGSGNMIDSLNTIVGWFTVKPKCMVLKKTVDSMGVYATVTPIMTKEDCSKTFAYICQYDHIPVGAIPVEVQTTNMPPAALSTDHIPVKSTEVEVQTIIMSPAVLRTDSIPVSTNAGVEDHMTNSPPAVLKTDQISMNTNAVEDQMINLTPATLMTEAPSSRWNQHIFKSIKHINRVFNPKLRARPDELFTDTEKVKCMRICLQAKCCELVSHFPPEHCAVYCDVERAKSKGVDSVLGSGIWMPLFL